MMVFGHLKGLTSTESVANRKIPSYYTVVQILSVQFFTAHAPLWTSITILKCKPFPTFCHCLVNTGDTSFTCATGHIFLLACLNFKTDTEIVV